MRFAKTFTGAVLAGCLAVLTPAAAGAAAVRPAALTEPASLLALYDFSESSGTVLHDVSPAHRDAAIVGGAAWRSGAMQFTGSNYVHLPNDLLAGKSAATIVIETVPQALNGAKFLWNFGGSGDSATGQFFIQPVAPRLAISKTNWAGEQTVTSATKLVDGRSQSIAATIEKNGAGTTSTLRLFIDGTQVAATTDSTVHLSDLLTHTMNYIGKSAYGGDSLYQGRVSSFRVYEEALPVTTLVEIAATDAEHVAAETADAIDLAAVNAQNLDEVTSNLVLPTAGGVTWSSSQPGVVAADGTVVQPASDTAVTLTAAASVRGQSSSREFTVVLAARVDLSTPGEYTVSGSLKTTDTNFPLLKNRADPHVLRYTGAGGEKTWLFIATDDAGQDEFFIRSADTVAGLATAPDNRILGYGLSGTSVNAQLWAPELHVVDGDLFVLFAANANSVNGWNGVQSYTMRLKPGGDPLVRADWEAPQRVVDAAGDPLTTYGTGITLDMTHFEDRGSDYVVWSERNVPSTGVGPAVLKIAKVAPSATGAWKLIGERSTIVQPDKGWSANTSEVAEGPFVIQRDGKIMITFSGSGVDWTYAVGLATAASGADLLDPASWGIRDYPIWHYEGAFTNNWGPGHNSYTYDDDGNLLNVFHAKATQNGSRDAGVRMVYFREDGSPVLDMTDAEWLAAENRTVTTTVTVEGPALDVTASATTRCVAGKVVLAVRIGNSGETPVDVAISSGFGQATASGIASSKTLSISTRSASIPGGDVTVTVTGDVGGQTATVERKVSYPARTCS